MSGRGRAALILLCLGTGFLGWRAVDAVGDRRAEFDRLAAERAERERREGACRAEIARRDPALDAQADFRRGVRTPIITYAGGDVGFFLAPGIGRCASSGPRGIRRAFVTSCALGHAYMAGYNHRLIALAPAAASACQPSPPPRRD